MTMQLIVVLVLLCLLPVPNQAPGWEVLGDPKSSPALREVDSLAVKQALDSRYHRHVRWIRGTRSDASPAPDAAGEFAVVNYNLIGHDGELASGLQIWIDRRSRNAIIVPNTMVRAAMLAVVNAGHDLTQQVWVVERIGQEFHFTFSPQWNDRESTDASTFTVVIDAKSGKQRGGLRYQF
jgi:hypothetical protein